MLVANQLQEFEYEEASGLKLNCILLADENENDVVMEKSAAYGTKKAPEPQNFEVAVAIATCDGESSSYKT